MLVKCIIRWILRFLILKRKNPLLLTKKPKNYLSPFLFYSDILVTSIASEITYENLRKEIREICNFQAGQLFTMKWVDEEGKYKILMPTNFTLKSIKLNVRFSIEWPQRKNFWMCHKMDVLYCSSVLLIKYLPSFKKKKKNKYLLRFKKKEEILAEF